MKQPSVFLKLAAVVSALLLGGGVVSYDAGAFNGLMRPSAQPAEPGASQQPSADTSESAPTFISSSKARIFAHASPSTTDEMATNGFFKLTLTLKDDTSKEK